MKQRKSKRLRSTNFVRRQTALCIFVSLKNPQFTNSPTFLSLTQQKLSTQVHLYILPLQSSMTIETPTKTNAKQQQKLNKSLLKYLRYFSFKGNLVLAHGQFNNPFNGELLTKRDLDKLHSLCDLDFFNLNMTFDTNQTDNDALMSQSIRSRYFSTHSLKQFSNNLTQDKTESSLSIFHGNIRSLNRNLDNLVTH